MKSISTKRVVLNGLIIALVFLATYFTHIPTPLPGGYFNLGDTVIIVAAIILGERSGMIAGAIGSMLADFAYGGFLFAPITFVVKGVEGFVVGAIASGIKNDKSDELRRLFSIIAGVVTMVAGYFIAEATILRVFDEAFGIAAAISELPANLAQGGISAVLGYTLSILLKKVDIKELVKKPGD